MIRSAQHPRYAICATVSAVVFALFAPTQARAEGADLAQVLKALKVLEARVASLEAENQQARKDAAAARADARSLRQKLATTPTATTAPATSPVLTTADVRASTAAPVAPVSNWAGLYAGAAFGLASMHSRVIDRSTETTTQTTAAFTGQVITATVNTDGTAGGRGPGAIANLFLGYNFVLGNNVILGGQVEGAVSNIHVNLDRRFTTVSVRNAVVTPPAAPPVTSTSVQVIDGTSGATIANRWLVSALARGGVLIGPADYLYALGGWTYGRFELPSQSLGLHGGTIGAGWEHQLAPGWTLRAEGRYTKFQDKTVNSSSGYNSTLTSTSPGGTTITSETSATAVSHRVSADMWSAWLGVTHYFGP